jgi:hypothetical protein
MTTTDQGPAWGTAEDLFGQLKAKYHAPFAADPSEAVAWVKAVVGGGRSPEFAEAEAAKLVDMCRAATTAPAYVILRPELLTAAVGPFPTEQAAGEWQAADEKANGGPGDWSAWPMFSPYAAGIMARLPMDELRARLESPAPFPPPAAPAVLDTAELKRGVLATTAGDQVNELHAPLQVTEEPHLFGDTRDAIDAASRFEAATLDVWEYSIEAKQCGDAWAVRVNRINDKPLRGYLSPVA